jgi:hypothetical protein
VLKLALRYQHDSIRISIEIEGEALTPDKIPNILGSILEPLEFWLKKITRKCRDFSPGESSAISQRQNASHSQPLHPSGCLAISGPREAEALNGDSQHGF